MLPIHQQHWSACVITPSDGLHLHTNHNMPLMQAHNVCAATRWFCVKNAKRQS